MVVGVMYLWGFGRGVIAMAAENPSRSVVAEVVVDTFAMATDAGSRGVRLRSRGSPFGDYVFGGTDYGADISIKWISDTRLLIVCEQCRNLVGGIVSWGQWNDVSIKYDITP